MPIDVSAQRRDFMLAYIIVRDEHDPNWISFAGASVHGDRHTVVDRDTAGHLQRLVHVADVLGLDVRVLLAAADELRKGRQQALDTYPRHVHELPRHEGCGQAGM